MKINLTLILSPLLIAAAQAADIAVSPAELAEARRWAAAKFEGRQLTPAAEPALVVLTNHGPVWKNARGDRPMHLGEKEYAHGLYCHAPSKIIVRRLGRARGSPPLPAWTPTTRPPSGAAVWTSRCTLVRLRSSARASCTKGCPANPSGLSWTAQQSSSCR